MNVPAYIPSRRAQSRRDGNLLDQALTRAAGTPLIAGNSIRLLKNASQNYPAWLEAIGSAQRNIYFENYFITEDDIGRQFSDALSAKAREGVSVKLVYDWLGAFGKASRHFWNQLRASGVDVRCFNPPHLSSPFGWLHRDHRKSLVVDGRVGFITGLCVGRSWVGDPQRNIEPWRDTGVEVRGPALRDMERAFEQVWAAIGSHLPDAEALSAAMNAGPHAVKYGRRADDEPMDEHLNERDEQHGSMSANAARGSAERHGATGTNATHAPAAQRNAMGTSQAGSPSAQRGPMGETRTQGEQHARTNTAHSDSPSIEPAGDVSLRIVANAPGTAALLRLDQIVAGAARETLWLTDAYFAGIPPYVQALRAAALDGVDVRLLVPGSSDIPLLRPLTQAGYRPLLEAGVRVFEWKGTMLHAKTAVADGRWARVGSSNLNIASWIGNYELDAVIENKSFAASMEQMYEEDILNSTEIVLRARRWGRGRKVRTEGERPPRAARNFIGLSARGGSATRAAAGALRIGRTVGAALTEQRVLASTEGKIVSIAGLVLTLFAVAMVIWPRLVAIPLAILCLWFALALLSKARVLRRERRRPDTSSDSNSS